MVNCAFVLVGSYRDGNSAVPVQFEVKEFRERNNSLYMTVVLTKIDLEVLDAGVPENIGNVPHLFSKSNISLRHIFENVNPQDGRFLKYVPDGFLNDAQKRAKQNALWRAEVGGCEVNIRCAETDLDRCVRALAAD